VTSRIYVGRCRSYDEEEIEYHLRAFFDYMGGVRKFVLPGMKVLLKPNLCLPHPPEMAITTHPSILRALSKIVMREGASITIGDNPIGKPDKRLRDSIWENTGINALVASLRCGKSLLDGDGFRSVTFRNDGKKMSYLISREYLNADLVINVPKFKTHALMGFTGAVKNIYGIIPGRSKLRLHSFAPSQIEFAEVIADVYSRRVPELTVMDAVEGIEGDGPGTKGEKRRIGFLMAGNDGVLIDSVSTKILGVGSDDILTNGAAERRGLGKTKADDILFTGAASLDDLAVNDFVMPRTMRYRNSSVINKLFNIAKFKIAINEETCRKCTLCYRNCPVKAISNENSSFRVAQEVCVQCLCCVEVCPHGAINADLNKFYRDLKNIRPERQFEQEQS